MGAYSVRIRDSAQVELMALPFPLRRQINQRILGFRDEPRPPGAEPLGGDRYRLNAYGRRILYLIDERLSLVRVYAIR